MKILFISHYSALYGANRSLESLISYFKQQQIEVEVLLPSKGEMYKRLQHNGVKTHAFMFLYEVLYVKLNIKYLTLPFLWLYDLFMFPFLLSIIKHINPDIIYSNSSVDAFSIWIAKILRKKHVAHIREFMFEDFGARFLFGKKAKRWYLLKSDKLICVSKAVADAVLGKLPQNAKVIYNGVKEPKRIRKVCELKPNFRLGIVGNIDISKQQDLGIKYMADIVKKYPQATLHIVGDKNCPYKNYLHKLVKELHLENSVIFEGFVKDIDMIYNKFDILLMCSRSEGFGRVTIEAILRKIPVIGLDRGGTSELIEEGVTGFKFKNSNEVINAITKLITDKKLLLDIVTNAHNVAIDKYSEQRYVHDVYDFVINQ